MSETAETSGSYILAIPKTRGIEETILSRMPMFMWPFWAHKVIEGL